MKAEINKLPKSTKFVVHVTVTRELKLRIWLAKILIKLAVSILGCSLVWVEDHSGVE